LYFLIIENARYVDPNEDEYRSYADQRENMS
jgi:hypothetical protein